MKLKTLFFASLVSATCLRAQPTQKMAETVAQPSATIATTPTDDAILLNGRAAEWQATANADLASIKSAADKYLASDGTLAAPTPRTLDDIELGRPLLFLYRATQEKKYALAAQSLYTGLDIGTPTASSLYADGVSMTLNNSYRFLPFQAAYAATFQQPQNFNHIAAFLLIYETEMHDPKSGLLHPAVDESKPASTRLSTEILAQPMGLYAMALVDTLDWFPRDQPQRPALIAALNRTLSAVLKVQDSTGLWWQVMDRAPHHTPAMHRQPDGSLRLTISHENDSNILDPSASAMFAYALAKGVRLGYLPQSDEAGAQRAWAGIQKKTANADPSSCLSLPSAASTCPPLLLGSFLLARSELGHPSTSPAPSPAQSTAATRPGLLPSSKDFHASTSAPQPSTHRITAMVDAWFNSQTRRNALGQTELFHYKWDDDSINGYSLFGRAFQHHNADLATLPEAPTRDNLAAAQVYVIASPDIPIKNPSPHYMDQASGDAIESWVRSGGVLILFMNDRDNTEFTHFNTLSDRFGIHFNPVLSHHVLEPDHSGGEVVIPPNTGIFSTGFTAYMKDTSTITPTGPAHAVVTDHGDVMVALSHLGKGTVLAIVDPWFYNEYADGRKMRQYKGFEAANDIAAWAVRQAQSVKGSKP